jgi:hypothetical protein
MTTPRDPLGRMAQSFGDMHHDADACRFWRRVRSVLGWFVVGVFVGFLIAALAVAIPAATLPPAMF